MKIGIIHFSDIHFKEKIEDNSVLKKKNKIVEKLKNQILAFDKIFLVISGDLAFSGQEKEYLIFNDFIQEIINDLNNYSRKEIIFLGIPGNHDCNFSESQKTRNLIIDGLERQNFAELDNDIVDTCTIPQKEYLIYQENNFFKGGIFLIKHKLLNIVNYQFGDVNIIFNCLNTSWTSKLHEQAGKLAFPINFFDEENFENDATLKINIIHHPINWQNDYNHRELRKFLNVNGDITLSGHEHQIDINKMIDVNGNENIFIETGALQDSVNKNSSTFNLINIDFDSKEIVVKTFNYSEGSYFEKEILKNTEFLKDRNANGKGKKLNTSFSKYLDSLNGQFLHKRVENIYLDNVFVSPFLRTTEEKTDKNKLEKFDGLLQENNNKIIIIGEESSGKTTILKKYFTYFHDKGLMPLLIKASEIEKADINYIFENLLKKAFLEQYSKGTKTDFDSIDKTKLVILIDDFHKCKLKEQYRNMFSRLINENFENVIYTSNNSIIFNSISPETEFFNDYKNCSIVELSYELRYELIQKWNLLGENSLTGNELLRKNENYDNLVKDFIGKNFFPQYPLIILTALQAIDSGTDQGFSSYYKYLIDESLKNGITNPENIQFYDFFLAEFCYFLFDEKLKNISKDSFENFYKSYARKKKVSISFNEAFDQLLQARIIKISDDFVSLNANYIYYYYVASYISNKLEKDDSIKQLIIKLIERLYVEEFSGIIIFLSQLNSNSFILETLEKYVNKHFDEFEPSKLSDDISMIDSLISKLPDLILENSDVEERRKNEIKKREEAEEREKLLDEEYLSKEYDIDEDLNGITIMNRIIRAIKTFEIFGQVIKKNWGAFDGEVKDSYVLMTFNLSMRILSAYFNFIKSNEDNLVDYIYYVADKKEIKGITDIKKLAKGLIFQMASMTSFGLIKKVANSVSHKQLKESFDDVVRNNPSNSFKLIRLAIMMEHFGTLPNDEINHLMKRDKEFNKFSIPKILLRNFVYQYLYLYDVPYDERARICNVVGITMEEQRYIQTSSKQKKN